MVCEWMVGELMDLSPLLLENRVTAYKTACTLHVCTYNFMVILLGYS
jgi:hypothetical protein